MSGFCGIIGEYDSMIQKEDLFGSINLSLNKKTEYIDDTGLLFCVSFLEHNPSGNNRLYNSDGFVGCFYGDLVDYDQIPWNEILHRYKENDLNWFDKLKGLFSIAIFDKKKQLLNLLSDSKAVFPVYYIQFEKHFIFSSNLSTFSMLNDKVQFNEKWLYEYLYFCCSIDSNTFYKDVHRISPLFLLQFNITQNKLSLSKYGNPLPINPVVKRGNEIILDCIKIFKRIVPKYFDNKQTNLVALSSGIDSRVILSLAPNDAKCKSYTYGVDECFDRFFVSKNYKHMIDDHEEVSFGTNFLKMLPSLMFETVRVSGGLQSVNRSTLLYTYKKLFLNNKRVRVVLGGIHGDFYRGYNINSESGGSYSKYMTKYFRSGEIEINNKEFTGLFKNNFISFSDHIDKCFDFIKTNYGKFSTAEAHMLYYSYQESPKYFAGEFEIANNYFTIRQPYFDNELIHQAFKTEFSHQGQHHRCVNNGDTDYTKYRLLTSILASNKKFKKGTINGMPISLFNVGSRKLFRMCRPFIRGIAKFNQPKTWHSNLEHWEKWFAEDLKNEIQNILNEDSIINYYLNYEEILIIIKKNNIALLNKLVTAELILQLCDNRWKYPKFLQSNINALNE